MAKAMRRVASWFYTPCRVCWRRPAGVRCFGGTPKDNAKELCVKHHPLAWVVLMQQAFGKVNK